MGWFDHPIPLFNRLLVLCKIMKNRLKQMKEYNWPYKKESRIQKEPMERDILTTTIKGPNERKLLRKSSDTNT